MKFFIVGGTFDNGIGRPSGLINKISEEITDNIAIGDEVTTINGGSFERIEPFLNQCWKYDIVLWMPNIPNDMPKIRDVKSVAPKVIYINSKRNDNNKYSMQELINRSLGVKANLTIEFKRNKDSLFNMQLFDPLGVSWYNGTNLKELVHVLIERSKFLKNITRQGTVPSDIPYDEKVKLLRDTTEHKEFVEIVKEYAEIFHDVIKPAKEVTRFLGNASMRPIFNNFRCTKGFPSFREGDMIFVSRRNVDKTSLSIEDFVPVYFDDKNNIHYIGNNKPSVDTPIQIRLYKELPNINYMIHSHCYIENAPFTVKPIPCGGLEEIEEVLSALKKTYGSLDKDFYTLNLIGHGNLLFAGNVEQLKGIKFVGRPIPEKLNISNLEEV